MLDAEVERLQTTIKMKQATGQQFVSTPAVTGENVDNHPPVQSDNSLDEPLKQLAELNSTVKELSAVMLKMLEDRLEKAKKFDDDYHDVSEWFRAQQEELSNVGSVRGVPEGIKEQLALHQVTLLPL